MSTKVSALATIAASVATFTYAVRVAGVSEGKVAINTTDGLAIFTGDDLLPYADDTQNIGELTNRWANLYLATDGAVVFSDGITINNRMGWTAAQGPLFVVAAAGFAQFDFSALSTTRTVAFPDASGTVTLQGNTVTGSGTLVLATNPTLSGLTLANATNVVLNTATGTKFGTATTQKLAFYNSTPIVQPSGDLITALQNLGLIASITIALPSAATATTQAASDNSTKVATTAYVDRHTAANPQASAPTTGGTVSPTITGDITVVQINPAGTLATLTVTLPVGTQPGQVCYVGFSQAITALTITTTNVTATNGYALPTAASLNQTFAFVWSGGTSKWTRFL